MDLLSITIILFLIMDPIGSVATLLRLTQGIQPNRQKLIICREMIIALVVMLLFYFIGDALLNFLKIDTPTIYMSSGIILFLIAIRILFPTAGGVRANIELKDNKEPFIVPIAIPLIAGPSVLGTIILYSHPTETTLTVLTAIFIAWALSSFVLFFARPIHHILKTSGLIACERLMGMILVLLSIERLLEGIQIFACAHIAAKAAAQ
jgi:multiple antibiotic resistance protein